MSEALFFFISHVSFFILGVLSIYFFASKKGDEKSNRVLGFILLIFLMQVFYSYATSNWAYQNFMSYHRFLAVSRFSVFLIGPLIMYYVRLRYGMVQKLTRKHLLHLVPFVICELVAVIQISQPDKFLLWEHSRFASFSVICILTHSLFYIAIILGLILKHGKQFNSSNRNSVPLSFKNWIQWSTLSFVALWVVNLQVFTTIMFLRSPDWCANTRCIYVLCIFLILGGWLLILLIKPELTQLKRKYQSGMLDINSYQNLHGQLQYIMAQEKPFLNSNLNLPKLAVLLNTTERNLSQLINSEYQQNFKAYLSKYRIQHFMQLLNDPNLQSHTILELMYESGFNTKSAFNACFKEHTGCSPKEYRNRIQQSLQTQFV